MTKIRRTTTVVIVEEIEHFGYLDDDMIAGDEPMTAEQAKAFLEGIEFDTKVDHLFEVVPYIPFAQYDDGMDHRRKAGTGTYTEVIEIVE